MKFGHYKNPYEDVNNLQYYILIYKILLDYSQIEKYDPSGMYKIYDQWPQIGKDAYNSDLEPVDFRNIDHIVFTTLGFHDGMQIAWTLACLQI